MANQIFVNLPVKDLLRSVSFFTKLGFTFDPQFKDDQATCMILGNHIFVMLLTEDFFQSFTGKKIADTTRANEVILILSVASREEVNRLVEIALRAGAVSQSDPQDLGWLYGRGFEDPDGHHWELMYTENNY